MCPPKLKDPAKSKEGKAATAPPPPAPPPAEDTATSYTSGADLTNQRIMLKVARDRYGVDELRTDRRNTMRVTGYQSPKVTKADRLAFRDQYSSLAVNKKNTGGS